MHHDVISPHCIMGFAVTALLFWFIFNDNYSILDNNKMEQNQNLADNLEENHCPSFFNN